MLTTQRQIRRAFWQYVREAKTNGMRLNVTPRRIPNYSGNGTMHNTDTRCTFIDWLDAEVKSGNIDPKVAKKVTL